ncbi:MAG: hypothetical protein J2P41_20020 [Blastocatellia bacterium]|nr:hypothetical protein [Blastocatellia bacterium]
MRKLLATSLAAIGLLIGVCCVCAAQAKTTDFSGKWVLDKSRTSDLPQGLESYTMTVTQDAQNLTYETDLQGNVGMRGRAGGQGGGRRGGSEGGGQGGGYPGGGQGGGFPGGGRGGIGGIGGGFPGGGRGGIGGGFPGGGRGGGGGRGEGGQGGGGYSMPKDAVTAMALRIAPAKATFTLDGKETVQQLDSTNSDGRQNGGSLALKANWKSGGKTLELQTTRKNETQQGERTATSKDLWELSKDGQTLTVKRKIEGRMGNQEVNLVFNKQQQQQQ